MYLILIVRGILNLQRWTWNLVLYTVWCTMKSGYNFANM